jgi:hypothetical protein
VNQSLNDFVDRIKKADEEERKNLLQVVIKQIIYGQETIRIELFYLPAIDTGAKNRTELFPLLDQLRTYCYTNKVEILFLLVA